MERKNSKNKPSYTKQDSDFKIEALVSEEDDKSASLYAQLRPYKGPEQHETIPEVAMDGVELLAQLRSGEIKTVTAMPPPRHTDLPKIPTFVNDAEPDACKLNGASKEELLAWHKPRWQKVRKEWIRHVARYTEERFGLNHAILEELYSGPRAK